MLRAHLVSGNFGSDPGGQNGWVQGALAFVFDYMTLCPNEGAGSFRTFPRAVSPSCRPWRHLRAHNLPGDPALRGGDCDPDGVGGGGGSGGRWARALGTVKEAGGQELLTKGRG